MYKACNLYFSVHLLQTQRYTLIYFFFGIRFVGTFTVRYVNYSWYVLRVYVTFYIVRVSHIDCESVSHLINTLNTQGTS